MSRTTDNGYGWQHQKQRELAKREVDTGKAYCWRCAKPIRPGQPWDLGHDDHDRTKYNGPEHVACNRATYGHLGSKANTVDTSRPW